MKALLVKLDSKLEVITVSAFVFIAVMELLTRRDWLLFICTIAALHSAYRLGQKAVV